MDFGFPRVKYPGIQYNNNNNKDNDNNNDNYYYYTHISHGRVSDERVDGG